MNARNSLDWFRTCTTCTGISFLAVIPAQAGIQCVSQIAI